MELRDATLMLLAESGAHPEVAKIAQSAHDDLCRDGDVHWQVLSDLIGEASGQGILRALRQKYSPASFEAIIDPILQEIGRRKPVPRTGARCASRNPGRAGRQAGAGRRLVSRASTGSPHAWHTTSVTSRCPQWCSRITGGPSSPARCTSPQRISAAMTG
jgi:hypothetical protein